MAKNQFQSLGVVRLSARVRPMLSKVGANCGDAGIASIMVAVENATSRFVLIMRWDDEICTCLKREYSCR